MPFKIYNNRANVMSPGVYDSVEQAEQAIMVVVNARLHGARRKDYDILEVHKPPVPTDRHEGFLVIVKRRRDNMTRVAFSETATRQTLATDVVHVLPTRAAAEHRVSQLQYMGNYYPESIKIIDLSEIR